MKIVKHFSIMFLLFIYDLTFNVPYIISESAVQIYS